MMKTLSLCRLASKFRSIAIAPALAFCALSTTAHATLIHITYSGTMEYWVDAASDRPAGHARYTAIFTLDTSLATFYSTCYPSGYCAKGYDFYASATDNTGALSAALFVKGYQFDYPRIGDPDPL